MQLVCNQEFESPGAERRYSSRLLRARMSSTVILFSLQAHHTPSCSPAVTKSF
jgi:hypothetical protein